MTRVSVTATRLADTAQYVARTAYATHTIVFAADNRPYIMMWGRAIPIDAPTRFGWYGTDAERRQFVNAYVDATATPSGY